MKPTYRVREWAEHYENHDSRKVKNARWVPVTNAHDGGAFRFISSHPRSCEIFAAWVLILQVASKCPTRGTLANSKGPIDAKRLSLMTGFPEAAFTIAFEVLTLPEVAWLESSIAKERDDIPASPEVSESFATIGNGTERKGTEKKVCSEEPSAPAEPPVLTFPVVGSGPKEWHLTASKLAEYRESYPGVDALAECRKARQWCIDKPKQRKTARGMPGFLASWLSRAQDRGSPPPARNGSHPPDLGGRVLETVAPEDPAEVHRRWLAAQRRKPPKLPRIAEVPP